MIPGAIDGYKSTMAEYNNEEYNSIFSAYIKYIFTSYFILSIIILLWTTYACFIKPKIKKAHKQFAYCKHRKPHCEIKTNQ